MKEQLLQMREKSAVSELVGLVGITASVGEARVNQISERLLDLTNQVNRLQIQNSTLTRDLSLAKADIETKTREIAKLKSQLELKDRREEKQLKDLSDFRTDATTVKFQNELLEQQNTHQRKELEETKRKYESLRDSKDALKEVKLRLEHKCETLQNQLTELNYQFEEMSTEPPPFSMGTSIEALSPQTVDLAMARDTGINDPKSAELQTDFDNLMAKILNDRQKFREQEEDIYGSMQDLDGFTG